MPLNVAQLFKLLLVQASSRPAGVGPVLGRGFLSSLSEKVVSLEPGSHGSDLSYYDRA